jgi:hypothetical protein
MDEVLEPKTKIPKLEESLKDDSNLCENSNATSGLSKSQMKKLKKREQWEEKKKIKRLLISKFLLLWHI